MNGQAVRLLKKIAKEHNLNWKTNKRSLKRAWKKMSAKERGEMRNEYE